MNYDEWKQQTPPGGSGVLVGNNGLTDFQKAVQCPYNKSHKKRMEIIKNKPKK